MTGVRAFARLVWRPASLWVLFPGFWAVAAPLLGLAERGHSPLALWRRDPAAIFTAWHILVVVAVVAGVAAALARLDLQRTPFSWTLPDRDRLLQRSTVAMGVLLAAGLAAMVGHVAGAGAMPPAFAVALFAFAASGAVVDAGVPKRLRWGAAFALAWPAVRPGGFAGAIMGAPLAVAIVVLAAAGALLAFLFSSGCARRRHRAGPPEGADAARRYWSKRSAARSTWDRSLATESVLPWLRAVVHESGGTGRGLVLLYVANAGIAVLFGHLSGEPGMVLILAGVTFTGGSLQLATGLGHPLSRTLRADVAATTALAGAAAYGVVSALVLLAVRGLGVPVIPWLASDPSRLTWLAAIGLAVAWAPVAQWDAVRQPHAGPKKAFGTRALGRTMVHMAGFIIVGHLTARALRSAGTVDTLLAIAVLVVVVHIAFRLLLRRHYARADLLPSGPGPARGAWT
jgi:hypothetical protein